MSTITAIALDRLIESSSTKSMGPARYSADSKLERMHGTPNSGVEKGIDAYAPRSRLERGVSVPPNPKIERENGVGVDQNVEGLRRGYPPYDSKPYRRNHDSSAGATNKTHHWTQITPALYATPASTPLPDSPSSFAPSPYIINHKRRGPRLMKSFSEDDVVTREKSTDENEE